MTADPGPEEEGKATRGNVAWTVARWATAAAVVGLLGLLVWSLVRSSNGAHFVHATEQGRKPPAPPFKLAVIWDHSDTWPDRLRPGLRDGSVTLGELRGQVAVINFWASWCYPCKQEAPAFARVARRFNGRVAFVGIDVQDLKSSERGFLRRYKVNYVSVRDGTDKTYSAYGLTGVPETYFVDARGRTVEHAIGRLTAKDLARMVEQLLKERRS